MREYGQFCPVSRGAEIFAERWTPLILRELLGGSHRFSERQLGLPRISRNRLAQRLVAPGPSRLVQRRTLGPSRGCLTQLAPRRATTGACCTASPGAATSAAGRTGMRLTAGARVRSRTSSIVRHSVMVEDAARNGRTSSHSWIGFNAGPLMR